ncbi:hypothetical protein MSC49_16440 [Methylosinus sp. C49]|nr:hypothetical protein MSC49_16440 [Methylosinus sp. C49]
MGANAREHGTRHAAIELDIDARIRTTECADERRQNIRDVIVDRAEANRAIGFFGAERAKRLSVERQHAPRVIEHELAFGSEAKTPLGTHDQADADNVFETLDLEADGRLGSVQRPGGGSKPALVDDRHEHMKKVVLENLIAYDADAGRPVVSRRSERRIFVSTRL